MKRKMRGNPTSTKITQTQKSKTKSKLEAFGKPPKQKKISIILLSILAIIIIAGSIFLYQLSKDLPALTTLERIDPEMATQVYSVDGEVLHSFFRFNRTFTPFDKIPKTVIDALISVEDREFHNHWGINLAGILRAVIIDLIYLDPTKQGASTITMQLARNLYFGFEQTYARKIKEALTAVQIERTYAKNEILEMYLNFNFFGSNAYGIKSGARRYFDKPVEELEIQEAAMLIGILKGQTYYTPIRHPERSLQRRNVVLSMMVDNGKLTKIEFDSLKQLPLNLTLNDPNEME